MTQAVATQTSVDEVPSLRRRLASFIYEGLILFGMLLIPGALGAALVAITGQQQSHQSDLILGVFSFLLYGAYFSWFWWKRGQTLPMQTWHIKLMTADGQPLSVGRATARYLLSWLWFAPALVFASVNGWNMRDHPRLMVASLVAGIAIYALLARWLPQRQFLHDVICGTRLVSSKLEPRRRQ